MTLLNRSLNRITWVVWVTWVSTMWAHKSRGGSPLQTQPLNGLIFWTSCWAIWDIELVGLLNFIKSGWIHLESPYSYRVWISCVSSFDAQVDPETVGAGNVLVGRAGSGQFYEKKKHRCESSRSKTDMAFNIVNNFQKLALQTLSVSQSSKHNTHSQAFKQFYSP